jgi:hypothetical protein
MRSLTLVPATAALALGAACVAPTTRLGSVSAEAVRAEQLRLSSDIRG